MLSASWDDWPRIPTQTSKDNSSRYRSTSRRLLTRFSEDRPGTYDALITLIQEAQLSSTFVTLNYDVLFDEAIPRSYNSRIASIDDYIDPSFARPWNYVKLHGSVDWGRRTTLDRAAGPALSSHLDHLRASGVALGYATGEPEMLSAPSGFLDGWWAYPALAVPTERTKTVVCPDAHVEVLREALRSDPAVLVIGNQGLDVDLMEILRSATKPDDPWWDRDLAVILRDALRSEKPFLVVDPCDASKVAARFAKALRRSELEDTRCSVGFREFVESEEAERFFQRVRDTSPSPTARSPAR